MHVEEDALLLEAAADELRKLLQLVDETHCEAK